jgi:hypothetical protein
MPNREYEVRREHLGDRPYKTGDVREMLPIDAAELLRLGVLAEKAEPPLQNKMEPAMLNKGRASSTARSDA